MGELEDAAVRSFALRLIIHYVGDVHQPLHATTRVDHLNPTGDWGGNKETLPAKDGASNLHAVWDSVLYKYVGRPALPLSDKDWTWYTNEAAELSKSYPIDESDLEEGDFDAWAKGSLELSKQFVYPEFTVGDALSQEYIDAALPVCLS